VRVDPSPILGDETLLVDVFDLSVDDSARAVAASLRKIV
jgi:hypothetical protein